MTWAFFGIEIPSLVLLLVTLAVVLIVKSWLQQHPSNLPPFPAKPFPILGHLPYLSGDVREKMLSHKKACGSIFSMYFGNTLVIVLSGYNVLKEALVKQADIFSDRPLIGPSAVLRSTHGIISNSGASWKKNRAVVLMVLKDFFSGKDVMSNKIMEEVKIYLEDIAALAGKPFHVNDITSCAVANVTCNFLYGKRFCSKDPFFLDFVHTVDEFMSLLGGGSLHQWFPILKYVPGDLFKANLLSNLNENLKSKIRALIKKVMARSGDEIADVNLISRYLDMMADEQKSNPQTELSVEHLEMVIRDMMVGGTETTSTTILWFYLYMMYYPHVQEKMYVEIVQVIGASRSPTGQDKAKLNYVNAAIFETQRLASISPFGIFHRCSRETTVSGYTIPKDAYIFTHLDSALLDDAIWDDARTFRPDRFLKEGKFFCPDQFVPFGLGRRQCPGETLARMELFLFIVSVLQRYKIVPPDPASLPPRTYMKGATCPPTPYMARFIERESQ